MEIKVVSVFFARKNREKIAYLVFIDKLDNITLLIELIVSTVVKLKIIAPMGVPLLVYVQRTIIYSNKSLINV